MIIGRLQDDGDLDIFNELDERLPAVTDGLIAHFPFDNTIENSNYNVDISVYNGIIIDKYKTIISNTNIDIDTDLSYSGASTSWTKLDYIPFNGVDDFRIEFGFSINSISSISTIFHLSDNSGGNECSFIVLGTGQPVMDFKNVTRTFADYPANTIKVNTYYDIVIERINGVLSLMVDDGTKSVSGTYSGILNVSSAVFAQEQDGIYGGFDATQSLNGHISYFRFKEILEPTIESCILTDDYISIEESVTNLWNGYTPSSHDGNWSVINNPFYDCPFYINDKVIQCTPRSYMNYYTISNSDRTTYPVGTTFTLSAWVFVEQNCDCQGQLRICGENLTYTTISYDKSKLGTWQFLKTTVMSTNIESTRAYYFLLYANEGTGSSLWTKGNVYYANVQLVAIKPFVQSYVETSKNDGKLSSTLKIIGNQTLFSNKKHVLDTDFTKLCLVNNNNAFSFYKDGLLTTEYKNHWMRYKVEGISYTGYHGWDISYYKTPSEKLAISDPPSFSMNLSTFDAGILWRTFVYCSADVSIYHRYSADNAGGIRINNGTPISLGGWNWKTNPDILISLKQGWNLIELWYCDGDTGGGLSLTSNSQGLNSNYDTNPENFVSSVNLSTVPQVLYMTAELPIEMDCNGINFNEKSNVSLNNMSIYDRALSLDEIKKLTNNKFSITEFGNIKAIDIVEKSGYVPIDNDIYYYPLSIDSMDENKLMSPSEEIGIEYENNSVWIGTSITNMITSQSAFGAGNLLSSSYNSLLKEWTISIASGSTSNWRGIVYSNNDAIAVPGGTYNLSFEVYSDDLVPMNVDINNYGVTTDTGTNDNDTNRIYNMPNIIQGHWTKMSVRYSFSSSLTQNFYMKNTIMFSNGFVPTKNISVKIRNIQIEKKFFVSSFTETSRPNSSLEYNLYNSIGLDWSNDWSIIYWKKPIATHNDFLTGYSIESLGCNSNSVGGSYIWWGKDNGSDTINTSSPSAIDPTKYFGNWRMVSLQKNDNSLVIKEWSAKDVITTRTSQIGYFLSSSFSSKNKYQWIDTQAWDDTLTFYENVNNENCYLTQYGYDLKLGGWDNGNPTNAYFKDLIVSKRYLTDDEVNNLFEKKMSSKDNELYISNTFNENGLPKEFYNIFYAPNTNNVVYTNLYSSNKLMTTDVLYK